MIFWRTKCDILFAMNSDLLYIIYMLGKRGVTIGIRAGRSIRPSSWVVSVVWGLNIVVEFSYYCSLCNEQRMAGRNDAAIAAAVTEEWCSREEGNWVSRAKARWYVSDGVCCQFVELVKFYPHYNAETAEFSKCIKFENGLRAEIKWAIGYQKIRQFSDLVSSCRIYEEDTKAHYKIMNERKGK